VASPRRRIGPSYSCVIHIGLYGYCQKFEFGAGWLFSRLSPVGVQDAPILIGWRSVVRHFVAETGRAGRDLT